MVAEVAHHNSYFKSSRGVCQVKNEGDEINVDTGQGKCYRKHRTSLMDTLRKYKRPCRDALALHCAIELVQLGGVFYVVGGSQ